MKVAIRIVCTDSTLTKNPWNFSFSHLESAFPANLIAKFCPPYDISLDHNSRTPSPDRIDYYTPLISDARWDDPTPFVGMIGTPHGVYCGRLRSHNEPIYRDREQEVLGQEYDRLLANLLRQRLASNPGRQSPFGHRGSRSTPMSHMPGMASTMGGHRQHSLSPSTGMSLDAALERMMNAMGVHPRMGMGHSMEMGMGYQSSRPSLNRPSPYLRQYHSPFSYNSPGPPQAHSFMPTPSSPFLTPRSTHRVFPSPLPRHSHSPFASSSTTLPGEDSDDDDGFESLYVMPPRRSLGGHGRSSHRHRSNYPPSRRRYRSDMYEDSEDELDEYDDYEDDFEDEDRLDGFFSRRGHSTRWRGGY